MSDTNSLILFDRSAGDALTLALLLCLGISTAAAELSSAVAASGDSVPSPAPTIALSCQHGALEGRYAGSVSDVIAEMIRQCPVRVEYASRLPDCSVSGTFAGVDVEQALKALLAGFSYTLTVDHEAQLVRLSVLSDRGSCKDSHPLASYPLSETGASGASDSAKADVRLIDRFPSVDANTLPGFSIALERRGPPPELRSLFYPEQDTAASATGPAPHFAQGDAAQAHQPATPSASSPGP